MSERKTAPVILFTYNRPEHTRNTMEALAANELADETELYIFSDAAKPKKDESEAAELAWRENVKKVEQIRAYAADITGFANVTLVERHENYGLARNVIEGVTEIIDRYGKVIVLEDDLVTNPFFLRFMNDGLDRYEKEKRVTGVTGYSFLDDGTDYDKPS